MIQGLLKVSVLEVCLTELCVGCDQNEEVLLVNVDEKFTECKLLHSNLDNACGILGHGELVERLISLHYKSLRRSIKTY